MRFGFILFKQLTNTLISALFSLLLSHFLEKFYASSSTLTAKAALRNGETFHRWAKPWIRENFQKLTSAIQMEAGAALTKLTTKVDHSRTSSTHIQTAIPILQSDFQIDKHNLPSLPRFFSAVKVKPSSAARWSARKPLTMGMGIRMAGCYNNKGNRSRTQRFNLPRTVFDNLPMSVDLKSTLGVWIAHLLATFFDYHRNDKHHWMNANPLATNLIGKEQKDWKKSRKRENDKKFYNWSIPHFERNTMRLIIVKKPR